MSLYGTYSSPSLGLLSRVCMIDIIVQGLVPTSSARRMSRPTNGGSFILTRSVQRPNIVRGFTSSPRWEASISEGHQHAMVLHCTPTNAQRALWHGERTQITLIPQTGASFYRKRFSATLVCAQSVVHVLHHAGVFLGKQLTETREDHAEQSHM